jgi:Zn-dependent protease/tetratricopeptide (TPR) repeat protein
MDLLKLPLYGIGIFLIIKALQYTLVWIRLIRERQQVPYHQWVNPYEIPEKLTPVWVEADQVLNSFDFQYAYAKKVVLGGQDNFSYVYVQKDFPIFANVSPTLLSSGVQSYDIVFSSIFENNEMVVTSDCLNNIELPHSKGKHYQAFFLGDINKHLENHVTLVNQIKNQKGIIPIYPSIDSYLEIENNLEKETFFHRIKEGLIVRLGETEIWRYSAIGALKLIAPLFKASKQLSAVTKANAIKNLNNQTQRPEPQDSKTQLTASVMAFERILEDEKRRQTSGWMTKTSLFLVSVVIAAIALGLTFSLKTVLIFLGVFLIHELGHLIGMKLFGYKDTQILFLPFLGAVTIGEKDDATPMQKLVIYLLGPVPGVIAGFICGYIYLITQKDIWYEIALVAILINYLNLLPILPLDGGRVVEAIFFSRFPRAQSIAYIVNICILFALYFFLKDNLLLFLAIIFSLSVPYQWRFGKAVKEVSKLLPTPHDRTNRLEAIFKVLNNQAEFIKQPLPDKHLLAKQLFSYFSNATPSFKTMFFGGAIYLFMLTLPLAGIIGWVAVNQWVNLNPKFANSYKNEVDSNNIDKINPEEEIKQTTEAEDRWQIFMDAARNTYDYEAENQEAKDKSKKYYLQALDIAKNFPTPDLRYIDTLIEIGNFTSDEEAETYYLQALEYAEKHSPKNTLVLAETLERLSYIYTEDKDTQKKIEYLEKALEIRKSQPNLLNQTNSQKENKISQKKLGDSYETERATLRNLTTLAGLYEKINELNKSEELLKEAFSLSKTSLTSQTEIINVSESLADFYLRQEKLQLAEEVLNESLKVQKSLNKKDENQFISSYAESHLATRLGWINVLNKDFNKASLLFNESFEASQKSNENEKSWSFWIIKKLYSLNKDLINVSNLVKLPYLLDIAYIEIQQGNQEKAKATFDKIKNIILAVKGQSLEKYHNSLDQQARYLTKLSKEKVLAKENSLIEENILEVEKEDLEIETGDYKNLPEIDLNDPSIEKAKQTDWRLFRALAHKEVFDKLK